MTVTQSNSNNKLNTEGFHSLCTRRTWKSAEKHRDKRGYPL